MTKEVEIPNHLGYSITDEGKVFSTLFRHARGQKVEMKPSVTPRGNYSRLCIKNNSGGHTQTTIHRLVLISFTGPPPSGKSFVRHLDGNPQNNRLENLAWGSYIDNEDDKRRHGRRTVGSRNSQAKLTEEDVQSIRDMYSSGVKQREIATTFGVSHRAIWSALNGETWRAIKERIEINNLNAKISGLEAELATIRDKTIEEVIQKLNGYLQLNDITGAEKYFTATDVCISLVKELKSKGGAG